MNSPCSSFLVTEPLTEPLMQFKKIRRLSGGDLEKILNFRFRVTIFFRPSRPEKTFCDRWNILTLAGKIRNWQKNTHAIKYKYPVNRNKGLARGVSNRLSFIHYHLQRERFQNQLQQQEKPLLPGIERKGRSVFCGAPA